MAERIKIQQHDNGIKLIFTIKKDGITETLQGANILFKMKHNTDGFSYIRNCTITDINGAECEYILTSEDLKIQGAYTTELEVRYMNGTILSTDNPIILVVTPEQIREGGE